MFSAEYRIIIPETLDTINFEIYHKHISSPDQNVATILLKIYTK